MRTQFFAVTATLVLMTLSRAQVASSLEPGRFTALTMRQYLHDEVCIALSDGQISRTERIRILGHAKKILKTEEYETFKQSLDKVAPPKPIIAKSKPAAPQKAQVAEKTQVAEKAQGRLSSKTSRPAIASSSRLSKASTAETKGSAARAVQDARNSAPKMASRGTWTKSTPSKEVVVSDRVVSRDDVR